jgi:hypothetical protein
MGIVSHIILYAALAAGTAAEAKVLSANATNLNKVFQAAVGGDKIVLEGVFGWTKLQDFSFSSKVIVDASAAQFTNSWQLNNISNVTVLGGTFGSSLASTRLGKAIAVTGGSNLTFANGTYLGTGIGGGISINGTLGAEVTNNSFTNLALAGGFSGVTGLTIHNNTVNAATKDGFDIVASHNVLASHNSCTGSAPSSGAHPDCIQLWSLTGQAPNSDIRILDNYAAGNTAGGGADRVTISGNVVMSTMPQGIACYSCRDSIITDNFLVTLADAAHWTSLNIVGGFGNMVSGNIKSRTGIVDPYRPSLGELGYGAGVLSDYGLYGQ